MKTAVVYLRRNEVLVGPGWPAVKVPGDGNYMRKHLVSILCTGLLTIALNPPIHAQGIIANLSSDGRLVYENAPEKSAQADSTAKESGLFYWSNTQNRWKPVPPMYSHSGRAAHRSARCLKFRLDSTPCWAPCSSCARLRIVANCARRARSPRFKRSSCRKMS